MRSIVISLKPDVILTRRLENTQATRVRLETEQTDDEMDLTATGSANVRVGGVGASAVHGVLTSLAERT